MKIKNHYVSHDNLTLALDKIYKYNINMDTLTASRREYAKIPSS